MNINKNDLVESLRQAGDVVAQKVDGLYQRTRLSFSISSKESELADLYRELGQTVYEQEKGRTTHNMSRSALIAMIDTCIKELQELRSRRSEAGPVYRFCPACGRPVSEKANFCAVCGAKIEPESPKDAPCCEGDPCPENCCKETESPACDGESVREDAWGDPLD